MSEKTSFIQKALKGSDKVISISFMYIGDITVEFCDKEQTCGCAYLTETLNNGVAFVFSNHNKLLMNLPGICYDVWHPYAA